MYLRSWEESAGLISFVVNDKWHNEARQVLIFIIKLLVMR